MKINIIHVILCLIMVSCQSHYSDNEGKIKELITERSLKKGDQLKAIEIVDHYENDSQITVITKAESKNDIIVFDTLKFETAGDGTIITK